MPDLRTPLLRCCWLAGALLLGCGVFGSLWGALSALGDAAGARFFQGMFWGAAVCWGVNAALLVGLLTTLVLMQNQEGNESPKAVQPPSGRGHGLQ